ncbi:MAG: hypothetical protein AAF656_11135, partial [Planctomycetota bacterium]
MKTLSLLTAGCLMAATTSLAQAAVIDPIVNGSFETSSGGSPDNWSTNQSAGAGAGATFTFTYVENASDAFDGDDYVSIQSDNNINGEASWRQNVTPLTGIDVAGGEQFLLTFAYRFTNFDGNDGIRARLRARDAGNTPLADIDFDLDTTGTSTDWIEFTSSPITLPAGTVELDPLAIFMRGGGNGFNSIGDPGDLASIDIDAVQITAVPEPTAAAGFLSLSALLL